MSIFATVFGAVGGFLFGIGIPVVTIWWVGIKIGLWPSWKDINEIE